MRKTTKKLLSMLLALAMVLTLLPTIAFAAPATKAPVTGVFAKTAEIADGDKIVIYNPQQAKALASEIVSTYYKAGADVTLEDSGITDPDAAVVWTVAADGDGFNLSNADGNKLSIDGTYSSIPYDMGSDAWTIEAATTEGCVYVVNENGKRLSWSSYGNFSAYDATNANTNEGFMAMQVYKLGGEVPPPVEDEIVDIDFLGTSDLHGQLFATDYTADYTASGTYKRGLTRVASYVKAEREAYENVFLADAGDTSQGTPLTYYYDFQMPDVDDPAVKALRTMGYDQWVIGNHEFNYGMTILQRQLDYATSEATETESKINISLANYLDAATNSDETKDWATWNDYEPYHVYDYDGVKVAVMGIGNPNVPKWDVPANWDGIYFANPIDTYLHYEAEMLEAADMIVLVSHSGINSDADSDFIERLIQQTNSVDLVFSGHEHKNAVTKIANKDGDEINVLSPYTKARAIGKAVVSYNKTKGEIAEITAEIVNTENKDLDSELVAVLQPYETATWNDYMLQKIGAAAGDYPAANLGTAPSAFMDLINTVQLWGAYDRTGSNTPDDTTDDTMAQLSISAPLTSGDAANLISTGDIMLGDMFKLYRYENWFYQITMSGKEVHQWLEFAATKIKLDADGNPTVSASDLTYYDVIMGDGFSYIIDAGRPDGSRVVSMTYNGEEIADTDEFTVVVNNYRYNGGGNYVAWLNAHGCEFEANDADRIIYSTQYDMIQGEDLGQARNLLANYITEEETITPNITSTWSVKLPDASDIVILYTNDVHCGVDADDKTMGYSNLAALKKFLEQTHDDVVLVDAGDAIQGGPIGTLSKGEYLIDIMNEVGYDYATFGNHEFDYGMDQLLETLVPKATFQYLSCNFAKLDGKAPSDAVKAYEIATYGDTKIAFVGITTPESFTKSTPTYFQDSEGNYIYTFCEGNEGADLYEKVQDTVDAAIADGADYVVAVAHLGIDEASKPWMSTEVIANTTGIDVVLDGHSHSTIPTQIVKNKDEEDVLLSSTGTKLANVGMLTITADGELSTELISGYTAVDATADAYIKDIQSQYATLLKEKVASSTVDLTVNSPDGAVRAVRSRETNLGDLCADAYRITLGADIGFVNGGGIRASIPAGDITYEQVITVHPFGNMACVVEATGQQIIDALEMSSRAVTAEDRVTVGDKINASGELGGFLQVSGLKYTIDPAIVSTVKIDDKQSFVSVEGARRVSDVQVLQADGTYAPIDLTKTYKLASHNYMLKSGGDGLNMFMGNKVLQDEVMIDNQVLITYIESMGGTVGEEYANLAGQGRITIKSGECEHDWVKSDADFFYTYYKCSKCDETKVEENAPAKFEDSPSKDYEDVTDTWYRNAADYTISEGIMTSTSKDKKTFEPNTKMSRAMLVSVLYRLEGSKKVEKPSKSFTDVPADEWYTDAVLWAAENEIVKGTGDGTTFNPNADITREQIAQILYNYCKTFKKLDVSKTDDLKAFADADKVSSWAADAVKWAVAEKLISGRTNNGKTELAPGSNAMRSEVAAILANLAKNITIPATWTK